MNKIQQDAYFRKRVIKEAEKSDNVKATAEKFHISRTSIYRWRKRYDGTIESLMEKSHRPQSHPNQQTEEELRLITKVWSHNKSLDLVCLHMILVDKHHYTRCVSTLNRTMKKLVIGRKSSEGRNIFQSRTVRQKQPGNAFRQTSNLCLRGALYQALRSFTNTRL